MVRRRGPVPRPPPPEPAVDPDHEADDGQAYQGHDQDEGGHGLTLFKKIIESLGY